MELYTRYTHTLQDCITETGINEIRRFVDSQNPQTSEWQAINSKYNREYMPFIPADWQWQWMVTGKADYTGTFPKRLINYFWKEHGLKCPDTFTKSLGDLARQHSTETVTYSFEFVNRFDWEAGDFADENSCFWGDRSAARKMLEENDALAICFYGQYERGIGRAWIAKLSDSRYIVFNGYGLETLKIAQIFSAWSKLSYKKIALSNFGETGGTLYINNGGYLIGTLKQTAEMSSHDLAYHCEDCLSCDNCGASISEEESYTTLYDDIYCRDCFYDRFDYCEICDDLHHRDDLTYVDDREMCDNCLEEQCFYCENCYSYRPNRLRIEGKDYCWICKPLDSK